MARMICSSLPWKWMKKKEVEDGDGHHGLGVKRYMFV